MNKELNVSDATHYLECSHCISQNNVYDYLMPCIPLKYTRGGKLKIIVFGYRFWANKDNKKRIRYVDPGRVFKK